jgi:hypothetical protein
MESKGTENTVAAKDTNTGRQQGYGSPEKADFNYPN